jgi:cytochrome P450
MKSPSEYDFLDPNLQRCPYEVYHALREEAPVYLEPRTGYYLVSRYQDIMEVKKNTRVFSNNFMKAVGGRPPAEALEVYKQCRARPATLHRTDPPVHDRYRKLVGRTFTIGRVRQMAPYITSVVKDLMDRFPANGEVDWVTQYAIPLPCYIIADQLGVPREDALKLKVWSDALLDPVGLMVTKERIVECAHQTIEFQEYFARKIEERRKSPQNDILTDLSSRTEGEDPFSVEEVLNIIEQVMTGGNESTTSLIASGLLMLIRHPDQLQLLRNNPGQLTAFVEEVLRTESPVQSNFRLVTEDTELAGVALKKGAIVALRYGAANRDERTFDASDDFDLTRKNVNSHIAFGAGIHHCPGSQLARQEAFQTFTELLHRYESFELLADDGTLPYHPTFFLRGLRSLPVRLVRKTD